ncbi:hypothetical protein GE21DRAFT_1000339 [Neurospora crassa]|nr:hypothetical protein GE21DRAFT_1000339 [Neurospora crassa]
MILDGSHPVSSCYTVKTIRILEFQVPRNWILLMLFRLAVSWWTTILLICHDFNDLENKTTHTDERCKWLFANVCGMKKGNETERRMAGFIAFHVGQIIRGSWSVINFMYDILFHNQSSST